MLIVWAVVGAAVAAMLFVTLYEVGHREEMPAWAETYGGFHFLIPLVVAGIVAAVLLPVLFFLDYAHRTFDVGHVGLALVAGVIGLLGVYGQLRRIRRSRAASRAQPGIVVANVNTAENAGEPTPDPRPLRPSGASGKRLRKAA